MSMLTNPKRLVITTVPKSAIKKESGVTTIRLPPEVDVKSNKMINNSQNGRISPLVKMPIPKNNQPEKRIYIHVAPEMPKIKDELKEKSEENETGPPVRKRQRLDHLSFEQKLMRR